MTLGSLMVRVGADITDMQRKMTEMQRSLKGASDAMHRVGKTMSVAVTAPIVAMGVASVMAFDKQAKAIAAVESRLKSTGGAAGYTSAALQEMAADLQKISLFGDEEILTRVTQQLLTFPAVAGEAFKRAQVAALDLSQTLGQDLQSSTIMLGKALQDPVLGLTAMRRVGISFSESQQTVIKSLAETGRLAEAQGLILDELSRQYGGAAEAASKAGTGPLKQLSNAFGDLQEEIGAIVFDYLAPLIDKLGKAVAWFRALSPEIKRNVVVFAGLAATVGPALLAMGGMLKMIPFLVGGFAALTSPVALAGLAIAGLAAIGIALVNDWGGVRTFIEKEFPRALTVLKTAFSTTVETVRDAMAAVVRIVSDAFKNVRDAVNAFSAAFSGDWEKMWTNIIDISDRSMGQLTDGFSAWGTKTARQMKGIGSFVAEGFTGGFREKINAARLFSADWLSGGARLQIMEAKKWAGEIADGFASALARRGQNPTAAFMQIAPTAGLGVGKLDLVLQAVQARFEKIAPPTKKATGELVNMAAAADRLRGRIADLMAPGDLGKAMKARFGDILGTDMLNRQVKGVKVEMPVETDVDMRGTAPWRLIEASKIASDRLRTVAKDAAMMEDRGREAFENVTTSTLKWNTVLARVGEAVKGVSVLLSDRLGAAFGDLVFNVLAFNSGISGTEAALQRLDFQDQLARLKEGMEEGTLSAERYRLEVSLIQEKQAEFETSISGIKSAFKDLGTTIKQVLAGVVADLAAAIAKAAIFAGLMAIISPSTKIGSFGQLFAGAMGFRSLSVLPDTSYRGPDISSPSISANKLSQNLSMHLTGEFVQRGPDLVLVVDQTRRFKGL